MGNQEIDSNLVIANMQAVRAVFRIRHKYNGFRIKLHNVLEVGETENSFPIYHYLAFQLFHGSLNLGQFMKI